MEEKINNPEMLALVALLPQSSGKTDDEIWEQFKIICDTDRGKSISAINDFALLLGELRNQRPEVFLLFVKRFDKSYGSPQKPTASGSAMTNKIIFDVAGDILKNPLRIGPEARN